MIKQELSNILDALNQIKTVPSISGGSHTPPELRLLLYALAMLTGAGTIVETGYDAGMTTLALACTGANVIGIDNGSEYEDVKPLAKERLAKYPNCTLLIREALEYLTYLPDESVDLIFIDDQHDLPHVKAEAEQVKRILRPGGFAVFHDTIVVKLWAVLEEVFGDWQKINLPCPSPAASNSDFGVGLVRKPEL